MQLSTILPILCGLAALTFPGIAKSDRLAAWQNGIIAGVLVAGLSGATVWAGGHITNNVVEDWTLFTTAYAALLAGPLSPLDSYLQSALNLPFLKPAPANANPVRVPTALVMPQTDKPTSAK